MLSDENISNSVLFRANTTSNKHLVAIAKRNPPLQNVREASLTSNGASTIKSGMTILRPESVKRANNDAWMAAAIGDLNWLKQSFRFSTEMVYDKNGFSAIHLAAIHGRLNIMKYLIDEMNIDANFPSLHNWRPIHLCISSKSGNKAVDILNYLLRKGAVVNTANEDGTTPLHMAASEGQEECLKILLCNRADPFAIDIRKQKPIDLARLWGHKKCAKLLASSMWHNQKILNLEQTALDKKIHTQEVLLDIKQTIDAATQNIKQTDRVLSTWLNQQGFNDTPKESRSPVKQPSLPALPTSSKIKLPEIKSNEDDTDGKTTARKKYSTVQSAPQQHAQSNLNSASEKNFNALFGDDVANNGNDKLKREPSDLTIPVKHTPRWNISTRPIKEPYLKNLDDFYPRDPYTLLPHDIDLLYLHRELNGLSVEEIKQFMRENFKERATRTKEKLDLIDERNRRRQRTTFRRIELERPHFYRPKNILDCETKKHDVNQQYGIDQASLNMSSNPDTSSYEKLKNFVSEKSVNEFNEEQITSVKNFIQTYFGTELYEFMKDKNGRIHPRYEKVFIC